MAFDFKKEYKEFYMPKNKPEIVNVPKANYIAVRGKGNPNEKDGAYQQAIGVLYAVAYTLKMSYKTDYKIEGFFEYESHPTFALTYVEQCSMRSYSHIQASYIFHLYFHRVCHSIRIRQWKNWVSTLSSCRV